MISVGIAHILDNIKKEIGIVCPNVPTNSAFAAIINALPTFRINDKEIPTFKTISTGIQPVTYYIELINIGKGIYGIGGSQITPFRLKVTSFGSSVKELTSLSSTQIIDFGYAGVNVIDFLNSQLPNIIIQDQTAGYVIIKGIFDNGIYQEFLWIGHAGTYGGAGGLQAIWADIKELSGTVTSEQNNFSRTIKVVAANLSGTGTIEEQICAYINSLSYYKVDSDADVWVEYDSTIVVLVPVNCVVSAWGAWSDCQIDGFKTRTRTVITAASNGGTYCPVLYEKQACTYVAPVKPILPTYVFMYQGLYDNADTINFPLINSWVDYYDIHGDRQRYMVGGFDYGCQEIIASSIIGINDCKLCSYSGAYWISLNKSPLLDFAFTACTLPSGSKLVYRMNAPIFTFSNVLYKDANGLILADPGRYSDGVRERDWNGTAFTEVRICI